VLAELEKHHDVTIITQNVDDLHERAGSSRVIHLHGELTKVTSSLNRLNPDCIKEYPLDVPIKMGDKAADGSQLRPFIVWFGEYLGPEAEQAVILIENADIFVVIGTSLNVYPAASLLYYTKPGTPTFLIDPNAVSTEARNITYIRKGASEGMKELCQILQEEN
jgi:NAD-dependent deacetylase